jgi:hypothetical protein
VALSLGVKRPGREADHSPTSSAEVKECVELYVHSPSTPSWRGAHLKRTGTTLPFTFFTLTPVGMRETRNTYKYLVLNSLSWSTNLPTFTVAEGSLLCSDQSTTEPHTLSEMNPSTYAYCSKDPHTEVSSLVNNDE